MGINSVGSCVVCYSDLPPTWFKDFSEEVSGARAHSCSTLSLSAQLAAGLARGAAYRFRDWPNSAVPTFGAGVYTIWHDDGRFICAGMSGRGITAETLQRNTPRGLYTRFQSYASGRRSGDQFCVYVADRLVLPTLSHDDIAAIASGRHQMDALVRRYIHENLYYRFVMMPNGPAAYAVENAIKSGHWNMAVHYSIP